MTDFGEFTALTCNGDLYFPVLVDLHFSSPVELNKLLAPIDSIEVKIANLKGGMR